MTFEEALRTWARVAALSFGGPAGQIAVMHRLLVEEKRWLSEGRFLHALQFCMLLPGPEAQQLATYVGWLLHGVRGGLCAGLLFVLPGFLAILALSVVYVVWGEVPAVEAALWGLKAAVLAVVVEAVVKIGRRALAGPYAVGLAGAAFLAIALFDAPFPAVVAGAALAGWLGGRRGWLRPAAPKGSGDGAVLDRLPTRAPPPWRGTVATAALWLLIWLGPLAGLALALGPDHVLAEIGAFFSGAAAVTFGGAYSVLGYVAQRAVEVEGWLTAREMLDGLGLAETTPGPLIQVVQFVGFLAAYREPGALAPLAAGLIGAVVTTWATFAPSFLWIFVGAPYVERLRGNRALASALSGVTAAVVGVVLHLAVWFALHVLFARVGEARWGPLRLDVPDLTTLDPAALALAALSFVALFGLKLGMLRTLGLAALLGLAWGMVAGR